MKPEWQRLLRAPLSGEPLWFEGTCAGSSTEDWGDGYLVIPRRLKVAVVRDGIPDFVQMSTWATLDMSTVTEKRWIERGWNSQRALGREPVFEAAVSHMLKAGPMVVELGAGPGGGHMPMLLGRHPEATVLVNDFELRMLTEWRSFFRSTGLGPRISLACFDACAMPLESSSVDCISSHGCFSNIKAHRDLAVKDAFRVLKPGGLLVAVEAHIVQPSYEVLRGLLDGSGLADPWMLVPGLITGWASLMESAGFCVADDIVLARKPVSPEDGDLGRLALKHGITIEREWHVIVARKESSDGQVLSDDTGR